VIVKRRVKSRKTSVRSLEGVLYRISSILRLMKRNKKRPKGTENACLLDPVIWTPYVANWKCAGVWEIRPMVSLYSVRIDAADESTPANDLCNVKTREIIESMHDRHGSRSVTLLSLAF